MSESKQVQFLAPRGYGERRMFGLYVDGAPVLMVPAYSVEEAREAGILHFERHRHLETLAAWRDAGGVVAQIVGWEW